MRPVHTLAREESKRTLPLLISTDAENVTIKRRKKGESSGIEGGGRGKLKKVVYLKVL